MRWRCAVILFLLSTASAFAGKPKITLADARKIALARVPGKVVHEKQKTKHDHVVFNFKITPIKPHAGYVDKVEVDGDTGKILKVEEVKIKAPD